MWLCVIKKINGHPPKKILHASSNSISFNDNNDNNNSIQNIDTERKQRGLNRKHNERMRSNEEIQGTTLVLILIL